MAEFTVLEVAVEDVFALDFANAFNVDLLTFLSSVFCFRAANRVSIYFSLVNWSK